MGLNDSAWEKIFKEKDALNEIYKIGYFKISANEIKLYREPRLMTKFDHAKNLPKIFADNNLSILPIDRGNYVISDFNAYESFEELPQKGERISIPEYIESFNYGISSETIALNCASVCDVLSMFLDDEDVVSTVNGRMSSGKFDYYINRLGKYKDPAHIYVDHSQIEIDAAYESRKYLTIFEAKNDISNDFLIRQLYYPYRTWSSRISKKVKTVFLIYSNSCYYLFDYEFEDVNNYNSLHLAKKAKYYLSSPITLSDIDVLIKNISFTEEKKIPFPQADSMKRLFNLFELLEEKSMTDVDITTKYDFDVRQTSYYTNAGMYLGMIKKEHIKKIDGNGDSANSNYTLTDSGEKLMHQEYKVRALGISRRILSHKVFYYSFLAWLKNGIPLSKEEIVEIMKQYKVFNVTSNETYERRAQTVSGWLSWIMSLIEE